MANAYLEKLRSIGVSLRRGESNRTVSVERGPHGNARVEEVEHWDGRKDSTVTPATVRYGARIAKSKGVPKAVEVHEMSEKERRNHYGE